MAKADLTLYRNTTYNMHYNHLEDMTGGKVYFTVKSRQFDDSVDDSTSMPQKTIPTFTNGGFRADWQLSDSDMYIEPGTYFYDIVYENSSGEAAPPIFEGKFKVKGHPTNRSMN